MTRIIPMPEETIRQLMRFTLRYWAELQSLSAEAQMKGWKDLQQRFEAEAEEVDGVLARARKESDVSVDF